MKSNTKTIYANSLNDLPTKEQIESLLRETRLIVYFNQDIQNQRQKIGEKWKQNFPDFLIGIHMLEHQISIRKLITEDEIVRNQPFFEKCAKDYKKLATDLINDLANELELEIDTKIPLKTFSKYLRDDKDSGKLKDWEYYFHGFHCRFSNISSKQDIEVSLVCGLEFGELDPYFFTRYIKSTSKYYPLPVDIYEDYWDGVRILDKMTGLGILELIKTNWKGRKAHVLTDREKVEIKEYDFLEEGVYQSQKKFSLWEFFLKRLTRQAN